jgi:aspartyl-tRNA(Asn)/glutamyl-tRNA(Gln) amidotransferase subunit B
MDYRFFPEPDLPPLAVDPAEVAAVRAALPGLPDARLRRYREAFGLPEEEARTLLQSPAFAAYFERLAEASGQPRAAANWMLGEVSRVLNERGWSIEDLALPPEALAELIRLVAAGRLPLGAAREVGFPALLAGEGSAEALVAARGLEPVSDPGLLAPLVRQAIEANPEAVAQIRAGRDRLRGFLVGQVLKAGGGRLDPAVVNEVLAEGLDKGGPAPHAGP